jgi:hypothetical protein
MARALRDRLTAAGLGRSYNARVEDVAENGRLGELADRLRRELGLDVADVPPPPPPAPPPSRLGLLRARASVRLWHIRAGVPEPMKRPLRKLLGRPSPAELAEPEAPSDVVRALEDLQIGQVELARRLAQLEERMTALEAPHTEKP